MITKAKASLSAVKAFSAAVSCVVDYTSKFDNGIACIEGLLAQLYEFSKTLAETVSGMDSAQEQLENKINQLEEIIARYTAQINQLEEKLASLESRLASLPETISWTDSDGVVHERSNPAYDRVQAKIADTESKIDSVRAEMRPYQERLEHANAVNSRIAAHRDSINGVLFSIKEKETACKRLLSDFKELQIKNQAQGNIAAHALKRIESIIKEYLRVKMVYENTLFPQSGIIDGRPGINININIARNTTIQDQAGEGPQNVSPPAFTRQEIIQHKITFDEYGRVASYDGKGFGGSYNSYDDRLSHSSSENNPLFGSYEGQRGESKYIPANRTVEGVIVNRILRQYNVDGIYYRNAEPDFEPCAEEVVIIPAMSKHREDYYNENGETVFGNFTQADIELAKVWNLRSRQDRKDWTGRDVIKYRKENNLTWHEKCDTKTMVLVRSEINQYFKHSGGCSECRVRDEGISDGGEFDE